MTPLPKSEAQASKAIILTAAGQNTLSESWCARHKSRQEIKEGADEQRRCQEEEGHRRESRHCHQEGGGSLPPASPGDEGG